MWNLYKTILWIVHYTYDEISASLFLLLVLKDCEPDRS
jgi:hypothetical protein